jgi:uncharacterized protein YukE
MSDKVITTADMDTLAKHFDNYSTSVDTIIKELGNMKDTLASMYDGQADSNVDSEFEKLIAHYKMIKDSSDTMSSFISTYKSYMVAADTNQSGRVNETLDIKQEPC